MHRLPAELVSHLCWFLPKRSLSSFRLTCKVIAAIAAKQLFHELEFRLYPSLDRLRQLQELAATPSIASRLNCLTCEYGVQLEYADSRYWQAQVYQEKSSAWEMSVAAQGGSRDSYREFHENLQARFTPDLLHCYDLYRWHLDLQAEDMGQFDLQDALVRTLDTLSELCPQLRFKLVMAEPQIQLEELEAFKPEEHDIEEPSTPDPRLRVANRYHRCLNHFMVFLDALGKSKCNILDFTAIDFPQELLRLRITKANQIFIDCFQGLKKLDVKISALPHSAWIARPARSDLYIGGQSQAGLSLRMILDNIPHLEYLSLEFPKGEEFDFSSELFDTEDDFYLYRRPWLEGLKSITLCQFEISNHELDLLLAESKELESLVLKDGLMEVGTLADVLDTLSRKHLTNISLLGIWSVEEDAGEWHFHSEEDFTGCHAATSYEGPYAQTGMRSKVEKYVREGGDCPIPYGATDDVRDRWEILGDTSLHYIPRGRAR